MTLAVAAGTLSADVAAHYPYGYAVVDVETTGLTAAHHRVLQIAVSQLRADGGLESTWSTLLDPGCDPGPVHIHGLTALKLRGSPMFADIARQLVDLLGGRILVAHNARFDWDFLAAEADRARISLGVTSRLCTIALSRRLDLPAVSMSLESVAAYWGVPQTRAHDAVDDTRMLVEILRHSLLLAHRVGATLPLTSCIAVTGRRASPPPAPRPACPWRYPGRVSLALPLQQGMKIVFTGDTRVPREVLIRRAAEGGLDVMNAVSSRTSLLVRNPDTAQSRKAELAAHHGTPLATEEEYERLLAHILPGGPKMAAPQTSSRVPTPPPAARVGDIPVRGPLTGRRVLILGGAHDQAADLRTRVAELGGQGAANLTASITDIVAMPGAEVDPRWVRAKNLALCRLDPVTLQPIADVPVSAPPPDVAIERKATTPEPTVLRRGGATDLPGDIDGWSLAISWPDRASAIEVDVVAFIVDSDEQVETGPDFCFYNQPAHPSGSIELELDTPNEALAILRPSRLPETQRRIVVAAAMDDDHTFGELGPIELVLRTSDGVPVVRATLDAATDERSLLLANVYDREGVWRCRAVGQGYPAGLAGLAVMHGVDIEES